MIPTRKIRRALLPDFEKPKLRPMNPIQTKPPSLMSIKTTPPFRPTLITPPSGRPRFPPRNMAIRQRPPDFLRPPQPQPNHGKRKPLPDGSDEQVKDLRSKIPRLDFKEVDPTPCNLHQSFEDIDQDNGLVPESKQEPKDPLDVVDEGILDEDDSNDDEVIEDPAPVDSSILLYEEIGDVIDNDWTNTVTHKFSIKNSTKSLATQTNSYIIIPCLGKTTTFYNLDFLFSPYPTMITNKLYVNDFILGFTEFQQLISCFVLVSAWTMNCILVNNFYI